MNDVDAAGREQRRLEALNGYRILDTPRELAFDEVAQLAADLCGTPIGLVSLLDKDRQFFKAEVGVGFRETPIEDSFCRYAILEDDFLEVPDATADPRFSDNPLVTGGLALRFYAGALLKTPTGIPIGTLCVLDRRPRALTEVQQRALRVLANQVMNSFEMQRAVRERTEQADRYRTLFDTMDEGFCIIEFFDGPHGPLSDYVHVEANAAYEANAGIPQVVGQTLREMVGDEADDWIERYGSVLRTGEPIRFERELEATGRYLSLSSFRIDPASKKQVAVLFQDVTVRRNAELELIRLNGTLEARVEQAIAERRLLADVVEAAHAFVSIVDLDGTWMAMNSAAAREFERNFGVLPKIGDNMFGILAGRPHHQAALHHTWDRALAGEAFVTVARYGEGDQARSYELRFNTLRDAEGNRIGAFQFAYDITDRLAEQDRFRATEEALRQAHKMEAVGQLTGGLAHDFNNLLAGISGSFEMIGTRLAQGRTADVEKYLAAGQGATRRASALTHRLLAFSRRQTLSPRPIVINRLMGELVELVQRTVGPAIEVGTVAAAGLWPALVDANQLENAILNLCINARDAMPDGGKITIETGNRWIDQRTAKQHGLEAGQYVTICVSDTGVGIEKHVLERVFDPFFTTKPMGEGTGLGLSMVYGFARQSHGHVRIYSEVGQGTMVCLYLPRDLGDADAEEIVAEVPEAMRTTTEKRILIVDDEPTVRMLVVDALEELGHACAEAGTGAEGIEVLRGAGRIDMLITDVGLPGGMNGREVAERARELIPGLRILFITGYAENAVLNHGHIGHGMEVLTKPFAVGDLIARVDRLLREG
jgi:signal transduction histidine kinase